MNPTSVLFYIFSAVLLFAGFRVITARNTVHAALFLVLAGRSRPGQGSVAPYEEGLACSRAVAQRRAPAAMWWTATAAPDADGVVVEIADAKGQPVSGLQLTGLLRRPATEAGEHPLKFAEAAPGRYRAPAKPAAGAWDVHVQSQGQVFQAERRLTWP